MQKVCMSCRRTIEAWNEKCGGCGYKLEMVPEEKLKARFLRGPSLGALLFTQGWALGARVYFWFLISLVPVVGIAALVLCVLFGRRWSWKYGGWQSWEEFTARMRTLDAIGVGWGVVLILAYFFFRN